MEVLFWISFSVLLYTYLGYGILLMIIGYFKKTPSLPVPAELPPVTLIVTAYNEELFIEKKIQNSISLNYPSGKLFFLFVTDGCTDKTDEIIRAYPQVVLLTDKERKGKTAALNRAMQNVQTPVVVFTDANTLLHENCLLKMVRHYDDKKVGGVAGEKRIFDIERSAAGLGERLYWEYESLLKKADSKFYTVIGAAGELFSIRTELFQPVKESIILDDFVLSAKVCQQGYRFVYEEEASAVEASSVSMEEERKRKVRISAGCFQAILLLKGLLNPFRHPTLAFQYISHRVLRWTLCPICLPLLFVANAYTAFETQSFFYWFCWVGQIVFYLLAFAGHLFSQHKKLPQLLLVPYYFVFMNLSLYAGFYLFLTKRQSVVWKKVLRKNFN